MFLYTLYETPYGPGADAVVVQWTLFSTSFQLGWASVKVMFWVGWIGEMSEVMVRGFQHFGSESVLAAPPVLLQVVLCCFENSAFLLGEESLQELEGIFVEPCSCLFFLPSLFL